MALLPEGWLEVAGAALEYRMIGPPPAQAPTIVLLHEGLGCVALWKDFPQQLSAETECGVFVYSRRGYGRSSAYPVPWPIEYMHNEAGVLGQILDQVSFADCILMGHSDGASIAAIHQGSGGHPSVNGMVLMAPHFFAEQAGLDSISKAKDAYEQSDLRNRLQFYHGDNVDNVFYGWNGAWLLDGFRDWNIGSVLPGIQVPILVLQGEQDQYGSIAQVQAVEEKASGTVRAVMLGHCGHSPHVDQSESTLKEIGNFVRGLLE